MGDRGPSSVRNEDEEITGSWACTALSARQFPAGGEAIRIRHPQSPSQNVSISHVPLSGTRSDGFGELAEGTPTADLPRQVNPFLAPLVSAMYVGNICHRNILAGPAMRGRRAGFQEVACRSSGSCWDSTGKRPDEPLGSCISDDCRKATKSCQAGSRGILSTSYLAARRGAELVSVGSRSTFPLLHPLGQPGLIAGISKHASVYRGTAGKYCGHQNARLPWRAHVCLDSVVPEFVQLLHVGSWQPAT